MPTSYSSKPASCVGCGYGMLYAQRSAIGWIKTPAFITTIGVDRTIQIPSEIPIDATVAVIALPAATLAAIRAASMMQLPRTDVSDLQLTRPVEQARKSRPD